MVVDLDLDPHGSALFEFLDLLNADPDPGGQK
jgi:hypothetical protein